MHHRFRALAGTSLAALLFSVVLAGCGGRHTASTVLPREAASGSRHARTIAEAGYPNAVLSYAPLAYYRLDDPGSTLADSSPSGLNGTYGSAVAHGQPGLVATNGDSAARFPGGTYSANGIASVGATTKLQPASVTVEAWVNQSARATTENDIVAYGQGGVNGGVVYSLRISNQNKLLAYFVTPSGRVGVTGATDIAPGTAYFVVATYDGNNAILYVNGQVDATASGSGNLNYAGANGYGLGIGDSQSSTVLPVFNGVIDDVAIYGLALSPQVIQNQYAAGTTLPASTADPYASAVISDAPVAYYRLDDAGGTLLDATTNHLNGSYGSAVTHHAPGLLQSNTDPGAGFPGGTYTANSIASVPANPLLQPAGASLEAWVSEPSATSSENDIIAYGQGQVGGVVYSLRISSANKFYARFVTPSGPINLTGATVLVPGTAYHAVATYDGTTANLYVNGSLEATAAGAGSLSYAGANGYGLGIGDSQASTVLPVFNGTIDEVAIYPSALSAARVAAHYGAGATTSAGTVVWQTGDPLLGQYVLPGADDGQCAGVGPVISGRNASFTVTRNANGNTYGNTYYPGASTCWRNQMNPIDAATGTNFLLDMGRHYTFTFQTVLALNGNVVYEHGADGRLAVDLPAIVWQTHSYGGNGGDCDGLVIQNTYVASVNGSTQYGSPGEGGAPIWTFRSCDESGDFASPAYNSPDTLHDGQVDNWQIDIVAQIQGQNGGSIVVRRNGTVVYNAPTHVCNASTPECFWNFGPYAFYFADTEEPPGWNNAGVTVQMNNMTLVKH